jgi:hypothetical protein
LHFALKPTKSIFQRFAFLQAYFCQPKLHPQTGPG